ncbi:ubiquitin-conjugating enzyme domain-containing protein [Ditylenchus destructor]|uniref:Ubiquitin-conjugating enzyme domain-containing protein n=1 Tax=Ditylenchus destructor TaxID=166010 RepID=A0AAD4N2W7_9BILA|nr:ubiquitin-conjugating enzyme domain-containing protein [Ditylenchus destructor]
MACLQKLREDIALLKRLFPRTHDRFQIISASVDELSAEFLDPNGKRMRVCANIQENYPQVPPIWFCECDDPIVSSVLEQLTDEGHQQGDAGMSTSILLHIYHLVCKLCAYHNVTMPVELSSIAPMRGASDDKDEGNGSELESTVDDDDVEEDLMCEMEDVEASRREVLTRVVSAQRQQHLQGAPSGSITASDRLMKELREIYRSENYKKGVFSIDLEKDSNLYEWNVKLKKVDPDSQLSSDMRQLEKAHSQDHLLFHFLFKDTFPFEPPFVRLVSPTVTNGFVLGGGALCMELLTKQGWTSAYSIESLIMQIAATLVKGKARISFDTKGTYSLAKAQQSFKSLVHIHSKSGWYTPPKSDG